MDKNRLEAFSDGVMAIILTIMVLEFKVPKTTDWTTLCGLWPVFISYALSFLFVGLNWSSHHHLFHLAKKVNNKILWANLLNLFFLSLTPFATAWMGENALANTTVSFYAVVLTLCVIAYLIMVHQLRCLHGYESDFAKAFKGYNKTYLTIGLNLGAAIIAFIGFPRIAFILLIITALFWFVPNHHFEESGAKTK
jgi:Predicted integral membrane protein